MAPHDTIIYISDGGEGNGQGEELRLMASQLRSFRTAAGNPFNLVELPLPDPIYDEEGNRLPATYANYLITPTHLFVPVYGQPMKDDLAVKTLQSIFTGMRRYVWIAAIICVSTVLCIAPRCNCLLSFVSFNNH